jgi:hypothetical protein
MSSHYTGEDSQKFFSSLPCGGLGVSEFVYRFFLFLGSDSTDKLKSLYLIDRWPTIWATPPALYALFIFQIGPHVLARGQPQTMAQSSYLCLLTGMSHYSQLVGCVGGVSLIFCIASSGTSILLISASQVMVLQVQATMPGSFTAFK